MRLLLWLLMPLAASFDTDITLVASDKRGGDFDSFAYPKMAWLKDNVSVVVAKASVTHTTPQTMGLATATDGSTLQWTVQAGGLVGANTSIGKLFAISDFDAGALGLAAFVGFAGGMNGFRCGEGRSTDGFLSSDADTKARSADRIPVEPHKVGIFTASLPSPSTLHTVVTTSSTLPPHGEQAGYVQSPSLDTEGSVAFQACAKAGNGTAGIYHRAAGPSSTVNRILDDTQTIDAAGYVVHNFFGASLDGAYAAITANTQCKGEQHYQCGILIAEAADASFGSWNVTDVSSLCTTGRGFAAFGQATLKGGTLGVVAQLQSGQQGIYTMDVKTPQGRAAGLQKAVMAGESAPGGGLYASFPQPPSVSPHGSMLFRAYLNTGDTGIYHRDPQGRVTRKASTMGTYRGLSVVYMGSAESALGPDEAYTFYASLLNATSKEGYDGIFRGKHTMERLSAIASTDGPVPRPEPPQPRIEAGFATSNVFWPYDADENGTVYPCTYIPTLVLANHTRLIALGSCTTEEEDCNGFHIASRSRHHRHIPSGALSDENWGGNPIIRNTLCQKHSDDGGKTWSRLKVASRHSQNGQIVWDDVRKVLIAMWTPGNKIPLQEHRSYDLGETWSPPRNMSFLFPQGPKGDGSNSFWASAGAGVQLSATNPFHPGRLVFTGRMNGCGVFWYSDDGGKTYNMSTNATTGEPYCAPAIGETAIAETPDGGIMSSSRNGIFHGPGKCDCRATTHSRDGGSSFGAVGFDPVLVEPECMGTMVNAGPENAIFHANPGHGTDKESKSPPNGRASGTVRRTLNGGKNWTSVVLNGHDAYSYSCLSKMPTQDFVGLAWETVLPGSGVPASWSANNIVFTSIPTNFTGQ